MFDGVEWDDLFENSGLSDHWILDWNKLEA